MSYRTTLCLWDSSVRLSDGWRHRIITNTQTPDCFSISCEIGSELVLELVVFDAAQSRFLRGRNLALKT